LNDTEAREIGDGAADELRTRLEQKYAPKLLAIVSKAPETDKKYKSTWDEYVAYVKDAAYLRSRRAPHSSRHISIISSRKAPPKLRSSWCALRSLNGRSHAGARTIRFGLGD
jgi:hypothetical protein